MKLRTKPIHMFQVKVPGHSLISKRAFQQLVDLNGETLDSAAR